MQNEEKEIAVNVSFCLQLSYVDWRICSPFSRLMSSSLLFKTRESDTERERERERKKEIERDRRGEEVLKWKRFFLYSRQMFSFHYKLIK